jgi:NRAMP (natural resistance-associated macrophage protein)-like metal ion transporter
VTVAPKVAKKSSSSRAKLISPRRLRLAAFLAVMGPGIIAGLSDDDPAGITTYSIMGAKYGYRLLWVLVISTIALILFQDLGARIGVVTRQGLIGLVRQKYGARSGILSASALLLANVGTMTAEFAGIAAAGQLFGYSRYLTVPIAALLVSFLVLRGSFVRLEKIFFILSAIFFSYIVAGFLSHPNWGQAFHGTFVPTIPFTHDAVFIATATLGTTLAPWGLAFIQSYAVDKRLTRDDLKLLRVDVWTGSILTGVIGFFVIVTCAATLNRQHISINDASDVAAALKPLAGNLAKDLFAIGLIGAALLAASILPLSTAYSISDLTGRPAALDDSPREAPLFYGTFAAITVLSAVLILLPGAPLITILVLTQILNAVLLLPLLLYMFGISKDKRLMGEFVASKFMRGIYIVIIAIVFFCIACMLWFSFR